MDKDYHVFDAIEDLAFIQESAIYTVSGCYGVGKTHFLNEYLEHHSANYTIVKFDLASDQELDQTERNKKFFLKIWDQLDDERIQSRLGDPNTRDQIRPQHIVDHILGGMRDKRDAFVDTIIPSGWPRIMDALQVKLRERDIGEAKKIIWCITNIQNKFSEIYEIIFPYQELIKCDLDECQKPVLILEGWHFPPASSSSKSELPESKASLVKEEISFHWERSNLQVFPGKLDSKKHYVEYIVDKMKEVFNNEADHVLERFAIILLEWVGFNFSLIETSLGQMNRVQAYFDLENGGRLEHRFDRALSNVFTQEPEYSAKYKTMLGKLEKSLENLTLQESFVSGKHTVLFLRGVCFHDGDKLRLVKLIEALCVKPPPHEDDHPGETSHKKGCALVMKGGGIKGLAYVGAIRELNHYYNFQWFVGTSAGAISAVLLGAGYTVDELETILKEKNFRDFWLFGISWGDPHMWG
jgi:GTPase SAR1 family protein